MRLPLIRRHLVVRELCAENAYFWISKINKFFIIAAIATEAATAREKLHHIIDEIEDVRG